jgi:hypothetical protein
MAKYLQSGGAGRPRYCKRACASGLAATGFSRGFSQALCQSGEAAKPAAPSTRYFTSQAPCGTEVTAPPSRPRRAFHHGLSDLSAQPRRRARSSVQSTERSNGPEILRTPVDLGGPRCKRLDGAMNRDRFGNRIAPPHRNSLAVGNTAPRRKRNGCRWRAPAISLLSGATESSASSLESLGTRERQDARTPPERRDFGADSQKIRECAVSADRHRSKRNRSVAAQRRRGRIADVRVLIGSRWGVESRCFRENSRGETGGYDATPRRETVCPD